MTQAGPGGGGGDSPTSEIKSDSAAVKGDGCRIQGTKHCCCDNLREWTGGSNIRIKMWALKLRKRNPVAKPSAQCEYTDKVA